MPDGDLNISLRAGHAANIAAERLSLAAVIRPCLRYLLAITGANPGALACSGAYGARPVPAIWYAKQAGHTTIVYFQLRTWAGTSVEEGNVHKGPGREYIDPLRTDRFQELILSSNGSQWGRT